MASHGFWKRQSTAVSSITWARAQNSVELAKPSSSPDAPVLPMGNVSLARVRVVVLKIVTH